MIIEISVAVIAIAFVVLVIYLVMMTKTLQATFNQVNHLIVDARKQLDDSGCEAKKTAEHTTQMSANLKNKMDSLDFIFNSIANVGEVLEKKTYAFKQKVLHPSFIHEAQSSLASPHAEKNSTDSEAVNVAADVLEFAGLGIRLWKKLKKKETSHDEPYKL
jgi:uncharacterized protein YoxC